MSDAQSAIPQKAVEEQVGELGLLDQIVDEGGWDAMWRPERGKDLSRSLSPRCWTAR